MSARTEILSRLKMQKQVANFPPLWKSHRHFPDLPAQFISALTAVHGEVLRVKSLDTALSTLDHLWQSLKARQIVVNDDSFLPGFSWQRQWPDINWHLVGKNNRTDDLRSFATQADVGISGCLAALAETGSVVLASGPGRSRLATLLPPVHVALVYSNQLLPDIFTWTTGREENWPANVVLVSGPSKTADIEQTMSIGVHGPKRFIVILIDS